MMNFDLDNAIRKVKQLGVEYVKTNSHSAFAEYRSIRSEFDQHEEEIENAFYYSDEVWEAEREQEETERTFVIELKDALNNLENESQFANNKGQYINIKPVSFMEGDTIILVGYSHKDEEQMYFNSTYISKENTIEKIINFLTENGIKEINEFFFNDII